jgi:hypothetical protein
LINAKGVLKDNKVVSVKSVSVESQYSLNDEIDFLSGNYVINHVVSQAPFGFNLSIRKERGDYFVRGTIQSIYFFMSPNMHPQKIDLVFRSDKPSGVMETPLARPMGVTFENYETRLNLLSENTLASDKIVNRTKVWGYNQNWYREYKVPSEMIHGRQDIYLTWSQPTMDVYSPDYNHEMENLQVKLPLKSK